MIRWLRRKLLGDASKRCRCGDTGPDPSNTGLRCCDLLLDRHQALVEALQQRVETHLEDFHGLQAVVDFRQSGIEPVERLGRRAR